MNGNLTTWYPAHRLRGEMNRLFDEVFSDFLGSGWFGPQQFGLQQFAPFTDTALRGRMIPALNIREDEENLFVECEVPGLQMENLELTVSGNELTIRGERRGDDQEGVTYHRREREVGTFSRVIRLPAGIDADGVQASLEHGILTITCPKAEHARPRRIEVKALSR